MTDMSELDHAEARAAAARERMTATLGLLHTRLTPENVADEAIRQIGQRSARVLDAGVSAAKRHPGTVAGGVALLAAFLGRHHIGALIGNLGDRLRNRRKPARVPRVPSDKTPPGAERKER